MKETIKTPYPYKGSEVPVEKSQAEINSLLKKYNIDGTRWTEMWSTNDIELQFPIEFEVEGVKKGFIVKLKPPLFYADRKTYDPKLGKNIIVKAPDYRAGMRCLFYYLKSMLEAEKYGLAKVEELFMSKVMVSLPDGRIGSLGDLVKKKIAEGAFPMLEAEISKRGS